MNASPAAVPSTACTRGAAARATSWPASIRTAPSWPSVSASSRGVSGSESSYESVAAGSARLNAPLLFKEANGWNTGIQVQNVGTTPAQVTNTFRRP